jgi:prepilin-type N-terminal cleavage/methylation domain-containing protein
MPAGIRGLRHGRRAFTQIELIFVLALLAIAAVFVSANMSSFFRSRAINFEARRLLSLTHYAQSRAVSEGVPVILWINPADSTYGLTIQATYNVADGDAKAVTYSLEPSLKFDLPTDSAADVSEQDDEKLGLADGLAMIRFNPDGFFDEASLKKVMIRQGATDGLEVVQTANRLGYEIRPLSNAD